METNLKDITICVVDYGLFEELAVVLARSFGRVLYYVPYRSAFPKSSIALIGKGFEGVERIPDSDGGKDFFDYVRSDEIDCFVFPDIMDGDLQMHLRDMGYPVWGSGNSDALEVDRWKFRTIQKGLGMNSPKSVLIHGIDALKKKLMELDDVYVKISLFRGDFETFHHINWKTTEPKTEEWEYRLGAKKELIDFLVEFPVKGVEVGYDGFSVNGQFPSIAGYGYEIKDRAYVGRIARYEEFPKVLRDANDALASTFKEYGLQGFYSNEMRVGEDKQGTIIDMTMRAGSPPMEVYMEAYSNIAEVIWAGANGEIVTPRPLAKYVASAKISSVEEKDNWMTIDFPDEIRKWVKLANATYIDGKYQIIPCGMEIVGAVIGMGATVEEAIKQVKKRAKKVKGISVEIYTDALDQAQTEILKGRQNGINF